MLPNAIGAGVYPLNLPDGGVVPLDFLNERTVGMPTVLVGAGDLTLVVTNPTLLSAQAFTVTVGPPPVPAAPLAPPQVSIPASVASPFVGSVQCSDRI